MDADEEKVIRSSALKRFKERFPWAKSGRALSKIPYFICHIADGEVRKIEWNRKDFEEENDTAFC